MKKAFTLIELIMTIVLVGIVVIPSSVFLIETIKSSVMSKDMITAVNLAKNEIEKINNKAYDDIAGSDYTNYIGFGYDLRLKVREHDLEEPVKEIIVEVYQSGKIGNQEYLITRIITARAKNVL